MELVPIIYKGRYAGRGRRMQGINLKTTKKIC